MKKIFLFSITFILLFFAFIIANDIVNYVEFVGRNVDPYTSKSTYSVYLTNTANTNYDLALIAVWQYADSISLTWVGLNGNAATFVTKTTQANSAIVEIYKYTNPPTGGLLAEAKFNGNEYGAVGLFLYNSVSSDITNYKFYSSGNGVTGLAGVTLTASDNNNLIVYFASSRGPGGTNILGCANPIVKEAYDYPVSTSDRDFAAYNITSTANAANYYCYVTNPSANSMFLMALELPRYSPSSPSSRPTYTAYTWTPNVIAAYNFENNSVDLTGNGYDLYVVGNPFTSLYKYDGNYSIRGNTSNYLIFPNNLMEVLYAAVTTTASGYTIEFYIRTEAPLEGRYFMSNSFQTLFYRNWASYYDEYNARDNISISSSYSLLSTAQLQAQWNHVQIVRDNSAGTRNIVYINGQPVFCGSANPMIDWTDNFKLLYDTYNSQQLYIDRMAISLTKQYGMPITWSEAPSTPTPTNTFTSTSTNTNTFTYTPTNTFTNTATFTFTETPTPLTTPSVIYTVVATSTALNFYYNTILTDAAGFNFVNIFGAYNSSIYNNKVWFSQDGKNWYIFTDITNKIEERMDAHIHKLDEYYYIWGGYGKYSYTNLTKVVRTKDFANFEDYGYFHPTGDDVTNRWVSVKINNQIFFFSKLGQKAYYTYDFITFTSFPFHSNYGLESASKVNNKIILFTNEGKYYLSTNDLYTYNLYNSPSVHMPKVVFNINNALYTTAWYNKYTGHFDLTTYKTIDAVNWIIDTPYLNKHTECSSSEYIGYDASFIGGGLYGSGLSLGKIFIEAYLPSPTFTLTYTITPTYTYSITSTITPTITKTITQTVTKTITPTLTITPTRSITSTYTITVTITPTLTITPTQTITPTITITPTVTPLPTFSIKFFGDKEDNVRLVFTRYLLSDVYYILKAGINGEYVTFLTNADSEGIIDNAMVITLKELKITDNFSVTVTACSPQYISPCYVAVTGTVY